MSKALRDSTRLVSMTPAADDFATIRKRMRRNVVERSLAEAGIASGLIPDAILLAAGFSADEVAALGSQRNLPLNETDLLK